MNAKVDLSVGGFRGRFEAYLRTGDFESSRSEVAALHESLADVARFESMEGQLQIDVTGNGLGYFDAACIAMDVAGMGSHLQFDLELDQTELPTIIRALERIV